MKEVKYTKKRYAKKVIDLGDYMIPNLIDRTEQKNRYKFDIDMRMNKSHISKERRVWVDWGSHYTIEKCMALIEKTDLKGYTDVRIVESKTGLILKQFKL